MSASIINLNICPLGMMLTTSATTSPDVAANVSCSCCCSNLAVLVGFPSPRSVHFGVPHDSQTMGFQAPEYLVHDEEQTAGGLFEIVPQVTAVVALLEALRRTVRHHISITDQRDEHMTEKHIDVRSVTQQEMPRGKS